VDSARLLPAMRRRPLLRLSCRQAAACVATTQMSFGKNLRKLHVPDVLRNGVS
jgi:hypothetical protein